jgi:hypothetical protein
MRRGQMHDRRVEIEVEALKATLYSGLRVGRLKVAGEDKTVLRLARIAAAMFVLAVIAFVIVGIGLKLLGS